MEPIEPIFITYGAIVVMAILPIWIGAHRSLTQKMTEKLSSHDAWMFPLIGSAFLGGLYLLFKWFSKEYVNLLLSSYFLLFGVFSSTETFSPWVALFLPQNFATRKHKFFLPVPFMKESPRISFNNSDIFAFFISLGLAYWYFVTKHWIANNILGLAFCIQAIAMLSLGSYSIGSTLLIGLFFYDIFWVFGTDVMVTVARNFDAPIKLVFPKDIFAESFEFSMLGLGDIVIPGVFIALLLRFDAHMHRRRASSAGLYFSICYIAYTFGLVFTIFIMHTFQAAQPALLYLVPACLLSSFFTAFFRGELVELFSYTEELPEKKKKKETPKSSKSKKTVKSSKPALSHAPVKKQEQKKTTAQPTKTQNKASTQQAAKTQKKASSPVTKTQNKASSPVAKTQKKVQATKTVTPKNKSHKSS